MPYNESLPTLEQVAQLGLSSGRILLESGANGRIVHEAVADIANAYACDSAEVMCQHAVVLVMIRRGAESCLQMMKVGEHGVNLRRMQAVRQIIRELGTKKPDCGQAQAEIDNVTTATPGYSVWLVCLSTGMACSAFGRLLGADWASFLPTLVGAACGQFIRHHMTKQKHNIFVTAGIVSLVSALLAGIGARICGSTDLAISTVAAVLLLIPGVAVLNAQVDILESKPNLAGARVLRVVYLVGFMALGLALAQTIVIPKP